TRMTDDTEALTIPEACAASRVGRTILYRAINEGRLVARKLGKRTLILRSDLRQFLAALPSAIDPRGHSEVHIAGPPRPSPAPGERAAPSRRSLGHAPPVRHRKGRDHDGDQTMPHQRRE